MKKSPIVYLYHIRDACQSIAAFMSGVSREDFLQNFEKQSAVVRQLEIIGEAVKRLPNEFRNQYPDVAWKSATGMRDFLIHDYDEIDPEQVWQTTLTALPLFADQIHNIIEQNINSL